MFVARMRLDLIWVGQLAGGVRGSGDDVTGADDLQIGMGIGRLIMLMHQPGNYSANTRMDRHMEKITYAVEGMTCGGCASSLEKLLKQEPGVEDASASHEDNSCAVTLDPARVSDQRIAEIVDKAGFEFKGVSV